MYGSASWTQYVVLILFLNQVGSRPFFVLTDPVITFLFVQIGNLRDVNRNAIVRDALFGGAEAEHERARRESVAAVVISPTTSAPAPTPATATTPATAQLTISVPDDEAGEKTKVAKGGETPSVVKHTPKPGTPKPKGRGGFQPRRGASPVAPDQLSTVKRALRRQKLEEERRAAEALARAQAEFEAHKRWAIDDTLAAYSCTVWTSVLVRHGVFGGVLRMLALDDAGTATLVTAFVRDRAALDPRPYIVSGSPGGITVRATTTLRSATRRSVRTVLPAVSVAPAGNDVGFKAGAASSLTVPPTAAPSAGAQTSDDAQALGTSESAPSQSKK